MAIINLPTGYNVECFSTKEAARAHMESVILKGLKVGLLYKMSLVDVEENGEEQWVARINITKPVLREVLDRISTDTGCNEAVDDETVEEVWQYCRD